MCGSSRKVAAGGFGPKMERHNFSNLQEHKTLTEICSAILELLHVDGQTYGHGVAGSVRLSAILHIERDKMHSFSHGATASSGPGSPRFRGITITLRRTTLSRTPPDE